MSTYTTDRASPFTRAVVSSMRKMYTVKVYGASQQLIKVPRRYPEALADKSWDNTGCKSCAAAIAKSGLK